MMNGLDEKVQKTLEEIDQRAEIAQKQYPYGFALPSQTAESLFNTGILSTSELRKWIYNCYRIVDFGMLAEYLSAWQFIEIEFKIERITLEDARSALRENAFDLVRKYFPKIEECASRRTKPEQEFLDMRKKLYTQDFPNEL